MHSERKDAISAICSSFYPSSVLYLINNEVKIMQIALSKHPIDTSIVLSLLSKNEYKKKDRTTFNYVSLTKKNLKRIKSAIYIYIYIYLYI